MTDAGSPPPGQEAREPLMPPYVSTDAIFTPDECDRIRAIGQSRDPKDGTVEGSLKSVEDLKRGQPLETVVETSYRKSSIAFLDPDEETRWIYARILGAVKQLNARFWRFDIAGPGRLQYSVYQDGGHYDWHMDVGQNAPTSRRKISVTVQLSDPGSYRGGELMMRIANMDMTMPRKQGGAVLFPSYILHRVAPVTAGVREALVQWHHGGSPFR